MIHPESNASLQADPGHVLRPNPLDSAAISALRPQTNIQVVRKDSGYNCGIQKRLEGERCGSRADVFAETHWERALRSEQCRLVAVFFRQHRPLATEQLT